MQALNESEILVAVVFSTLTILLLTIIIILVATAAHRRQLKQQTELANLRLNLEQQHSAAIIQMLEEERVRIGQNLHDDLGSRLSIIKLMLEDVYANLTTREAHDLKESLSYISQANQQSIDDLRALSRELAASRIQTIGLIKALSGKIDECNRAGKVNFTMRFDGSVLTMPALHEITIYRIVCELLNNILKHAGATEGFLEIKTDGQKLLITVTDNGKGFESSSTRGEGIGLMNIRHRINYLKGVFNIDSDNQKGAIARMEIPL